MNQDKLNTIIGSRYIAETFKGYGIKSVFYVESILRNTLVEMDALGISGILTHSEKAAAYMADGYARAHRSPGVCMAQSVGAANLAAGLQDAYLGHSPVIALTGRKPPLSQYRNAYQEIRHHAMFEPVTKYNVVVETADQMQQTFSQAFREATSGAPGPVHLSLKGHQGQFAEEAQTAPGVRIENRFAQFPAIRTEPDEESVKEAARLLSKSEKPVIVAGGGAQASSAGPEIRALVDMMQIPVATSLNGKGIIPEEHPLCAGIVGRYARGCANRIVSEADLVVYIGSGIGDMVTAGWTLPVSGIPIVQIDIEPAELGRNYPSTTGVLGDAKTSVCRLMDKIVPLDHHRRWGAQASRYVTAWREEMAPHLSSNASPIRPERLCNEIGKILPENAFLVSDTGYSAFWTGMLVPLTHPGQRYIRSAGSLGWGFPASLGVKCAFPRQPVVCFTGDGGFWYHLSELETACRYNINTVTVVNNNSGLAQCLAQVSGQSGYSDKMFEFKKTDFSRIAQEMGCMGIRVEDPEKIAAALQTALAADRPVVVDVVTDVAYAAPGA